MKATKVLGRIKGDYVIENKITEFTIVSEAKTNNYGKMECDVLCNDVAKSSGKWQLNQQANNALIDKFQEETLNWIGKKIPIYTEKYDSGIGINVDVKKLAEVLA